MIIFPIIGSFLHERIFRKTKSRFLRNRDEIRQSRTISCLWQDDILALAGSDLDNLTLLIIKASEYNPDHINHLPDDETTAGQELNDTGDDLAGIDAVYTAHAAENQQAEEEGDEAGTGGFVVAVLAAAAHNSDCWVLWLKKFFGAGLEGLAGVVQ